MVPAPDSPASAPVEAVSARRKVRVLFVNDTARNGGPGRSLYYILKFLDPAVVHRAVLLPRSGVISDLYVKGGVVDELYFEPNLIENPIEPAHRPMERDDFDAPLALRAGRLALNVGRATFGLARMTRLLRRGRFDVIYCNGTNADFAGGLLAQTSRVPAIWHVRYTSIPKAAAPIHDALAKSGGVRRIVCVSKAAAALFPFCEEKVKVIHNALDVDEFSVALSAPVLRSELGFAPDAVVFGSQGRILPRKGYVEMVRAADEALRALDAKERARCKFVVLGDTPEDIRPDHLEECRALVRSLGLEDCFHFVGFRSDVKPYVADFDVAVVPSVYPDPLPRAVIESMAMGKPVIAFEVGGVGEMLEDGSCGSLVPVGDVGHMAREFVRYFRSEDLRRRLGVSARTRIEARYDARVHGRLIQNEIVLAAGLSGAGA
ncbi:MAG: glycosyltransferase [Myxococcales bacterium]|nr:glycosyltransferase [Myxococcales bacterium]